MDVVHTVLEPPEIRQKYQNACPPGCHTCEIATYVCGNWYVLVFLSPLFNHIITFGDSILLCYPECYDGWYDYMCAVPLLSLDYRTFGEIGAIVGNGGFRI